MSTTNTNTQWAFNFSGNSLVETGLLGATFYTSLAATHPANWTDTTAITLASSLQQALVTAGFTDATCTVVKEVDNSTQYTVNNGTFV